jgi:predicted site-specific integrase-resolvase
MRFLMPVTHLNQADLAARLNISPRTLERWRWTKKGPAFLKIGGRVVYRLEDVETFEQARRCESTAQGRQLRAAR